MTSADWIGLLAVGAAAVSTLIFAQRKSIESMVGKRLDDLQESVKTLMEDSNDHGQQLVRHETILEIHGLTRIKVPPRGDRS